MRLLEQQNDALARHIQALEHAKSLAAVQSAQALHKIRTRQEQLRREADHAALQRSKAAQADSSPLLPGTPRGPLPSGGSDEGASPASLQVPPQPPFQPPPTTLEVSYPSSQPFHERRSLGSPGRRTSAAAAAEQPLWSQEAWQSQPPTPPTACGLSPSHSEGGGREVSRPGLAQPQQRDAQQQSYGEEAPEAAGYQTAEDVTRGVSGASSAVRPPQRAEQSASSPVLPLLGGASGVGAGDAQPMPPWLAPAPKAQPPVDLFPTPLPAADVQQTDIATMASRILTAHHAPGHGPTATLPNGQPYVDALGNPLGPTLLPELPNIKDDTPSTRTQPDVHSSADGPEPPSGGGETPVGPELPQPPASARSPAAHERASVAVAHERAPASARAAGPGAAASPERPERRGAARPEGSPGGGGRASAAGAGAGGRGAGDAADAAAGAAATPPSTPAAAEGGRGPRRAEGESPGGGGAAPRGRRRPSEEPPAKGAEGPAPALSEQQQAELEECLDTIKWCATSVTRESLQDVIKSNKPAPVVKDVLEAVALLLGQPESRWDRLKRLIGGAGFLEKIQRLNFQQGVNREQFRKLRERLGNPDFDEELIKTVCVPVVPLAMWCRAIGVHLSKTKFPGGPEIRPVASAGAASSAPQQGERRPHAGGAYMVFDPDIERMDREELQQVRDLTISRPAVGKITFHGETDCTGLDFEHIVRLEIGEVLVYPEPGMKPPIGIGLNKPATVTMYQCWPPSNSRLLQDPRGQERYKRKIQQMTEEKQATFIDYDCTTGVWKFSVDHF